MIKLLNLKVPQESIALVTKSLKDGLLAQGKLVKKLEQKFEKFCKVKHAIAVSNGTAALHLALIVIGIKPGDEVITTPFTFGATTNSILMCGAKPVFVDIDKDSYTIDPKEIKKAITKKTKAIIAVDIFGRLCDYKSIYKIAKEFKLKVIADSCQAIGAEEKNKMAGSFGDISVFSLYATKNLFSGEGGIITTNNKKLADRLNILRNHGQSGKSRYEYIECGYNYRMTDIEAAIALPQFKTISKYTFQRIQNAKFYNENLSKIEYLKLPKIKNRTSVFHLYTIEIKNNEYCSRTKLQKHLSRNHIESLVYYPKPLHLYSPYKNLGYKKGDFPIVEGICNRVLSLPIHQFLTKKELSKIVKTIKSYKS